MARDSASTPMFRIAVMAIRIAVMAIRNSARSMRISANALLGVVVSHLAAVSARRSSAPDLASSADYPPRQFHISDQTSGTEALAGRSLSRHLYPALWR